MYSHCGVQELGLHVQKRMPVSCHGHSMSVFHELTKCRMTAKTTSKDNVTQLVTRTSFASMSLRIVSSAQDLFSYGWLFELRIFLTEASITARHKIQNKNHANTRAAIITVHSRSMFHLCNPLAPELVVV